MTQKIQDWINQLNQGKVVPLTGFTEIYENFTNIDFTYTFPQSLLLLSNLQLTSLTIEKYKNQETIQYITFQENII
jgi:hypothetical protein